MKSETAGGCQGLWKESLQLRLSRTAGDVRRETAADCQGHTYILHWRCYEKKDYTKLSGTGGDRRDTAGGCQGLEVMWARRDCRRPPGTGVWGCYESPYSASIYIWIWILHLYIIIIHDNKMNYKISSATIFFILFNTYFNTVVTTDIWVEIKLVQVKSAVCR